MPHIPLLLELDFWLVCFVAYLVVSFFAYSFAGWLYEVVYSVFEHHRFINRGFVFGPVCPIYGTGALLAIVLLRPIGDPIVQFVVGFFVSGVLEYATSWLMELLFHARWWDYSDIPLNLNGRICVGGLVIFSAMMLAVCYLFQPVIDGVLGMLDPQVLVMLAIVLVVVFAMDVTASVIRMQSFAEKVAAMQLRISVLSGIARETLSAKVSQLRENVQMVDAESSEGALGGLDELKAAARDVIPGIKALVGDAFTGWSFYERKSLSDPRFRFTKYTEAYEWAKRIPAGTRLMYGEADGEPDGAEPRY